MERDGMWRACIDKGVVMAELRPGRPTDQSTAEALTQLRRESPPPSSEAYQPLPEPTGAPPYRLSLDDVIGADAGTLDALGFHVIGDTGGVKQPVPQRLVADVMSTELQTRIGVTLCYHLGDVALLQRRDQSVLLAVL